jgi:hypothetical protein
MPDYKRHTWCFPSGNPSAINILNHTNFALTSGNRTMSSGSFGQLSSSSLFNNGDTGGPRVIQLTLRLQF